MTRTYPPKIAERIRGRRTPFRAIRRAPSVATDITHPVLLIFDSGTGRFRLNPRIYPLSSHKERRRRDLAAFGDGGPLERTVSASPSRFARIATREAAILGIGGGGGGVVLHP